MNESSLTEVHRRRLLTQVNPCIPTNVTPKSSAPDQKRTSPNGRLRLRTWYRKRYHLVVMPMNVLPIPAFRQQQSGVEMASNILKEFWPDLERKFSRKDKSTGNGSF